MCKILLIILTVIIFTPMYSHAVDGEVYLGRFFNSHFRAAPSDESAPEYVGGIEIGHKIKRFSPYVILRPYIELQTLIAEYDSSSQSVDPASIRYNFGINLSFTEEVYLKLKHSCWHTIDSEESVESYNELRFGIKF